MSSNSPNKTIVFFEEQVRMPSPKSRRADIVRKVLEQDATRAQATNKQSASRPASVPLPNNGRIDFGSYRSSPVHFTIRPKPKYGTAAADKPLPATDKPLPAADKTLPTADKPLPAADKPLPAADKPLPATDKPLPAADKPLPAADKPLPAADKPLPTADESLPSVDESLPAADEPPPADESPLATNQPIRVDSRNAKRWRSLQRPINLAKRARWAIQFPKRIKPTSNGGHLVLSNHTKREGEKLINAIKHKNKPHKKKSWLKSCTN